MSTIEADNSGDMDREVFVEVDPSGRFGRYSELLGSGACKKVYRGFDQQEGIEVAWNKVKLCKFVGNQKMLDRVFAEVELLRSLKHGSIVSLFDAWRDEEKNTLNFITEVCVSGDLRAYRKKHKKVSLRAVKKWCMQILKGLNYMHTHEPCIIHRDLKCNNIFINGNTGELRIGDLGLAAITQDHTAHSLLGTPEFMAPEMYDEDYTESVDIYAFGMCVLEMVTLELPYKECPNHAHIYKKVTSGVRPKALEKVEDPEVKAFIKKCLGQPRNRPTASQLLEDPFFSELKDDDCSINFKEQGHTDQNEVQQIQYQSRTAPSCGARVLLRPEVLTTLVHLPRAA